MGGKIRWLSATKAPIRSAFGDIIGIVEISRDITESKRQEQLKNEFIATVSHELRTPLTSIMGAIGCLAGGAAGDLPSAATRIIEISQRNCRRLIDIVNQILDIEKIESGTMEFDRKPVDLRKIVKQVIDAHKSMAADSQIILKFDRESILAVALADPERLSQAMANLVSNAVKFSPPGSEVILSIQKQNEFVCVNVRDHGPGIPDEYKERIFEKFVQVDASDQRRSSGAGLGLSIAKQIVAQLDGELDFEPAPDGGTIFSLRLREWGNTLSMEQRPRMDVLAAHQ